jgi:hypothetical protein
MINSSLVLITSNMASLSNAIKRIKRKVNEVSFISENKEISSCVQEIVVDCCMFEICE